MPPRHAFWTIILDGLPTAFRAATRDELLPTLKQLQAKNPDAVMKWFARGRVWESPEDAHAALRRPPARPESRGRDWRPGGDHKDPRERFRKETFQARRRREKKAAGLAKAGGPDRGQRTGFAPGPRPDSTRQRPGFTGGRGAGSFASRSSAAPPAASATGRRPKIPKKPRGPGWSKAPGPRAEHGQGRDRAGVAPAGHHRPGRWRQTPPHKPPRGIAAPPRANDPSAPLPPPSPSEPTRPPAPERPPAPQRGPQPLPAVTPEPPAAENIRILSEPPERATLAGSQPPGTAGEGRSAPAHKTKLPHLRPKS